MGKGYWVTKGGKTKRRAWAGTQRALSAKRTGSPRGHESHARFEMGQDHRPHCMIEMCVADKKLAREVQEVQGRCDQV
jgi:hypothetical protein